MAFLNRVTCKVPGSTSNCGSGFDTLGLALSICNELTVERAETSPDVSLGPDILAQSEMVQATVARFFQEADLEPFALRVRVRGTVPQARGLGSSVTVRGGVLAGLAELTGQAWNKDTLVRIITELEGHPDNASAAILGGFTVSRFLNNPAKLESVAKFDVSDDLRFMVASPEFEVLTSASRGSLPKQLPFADAIASINGAACVVAALASGRKEFLRQSVLDYIHEPYRLKGIPGAAEAIRRGVEAGSYTGWLSGSGSSVLCVCEASESSSVAAAMKAAFADAGLSSEVYDLECDNEGLQVVARS